LTNVDIRMKIRERQEGEKDCRALLKKAETESERSDTESERFWETNSMKANARNPESLWLL